MKPKMTKAINYTMCGSGVVYTNSTAIAVSGGYLNEIDYVKHLEEHRNRQEEYVKKTALEVLKIAAQQDKDIMSKYKDICGEIGKIYGINR